MMNNDVKMVESETVEQSEPLSTQFYRAYSKHAKLEDTDADGLAKLEKDLKLMISLVEKSRVFSENEEVDDINTVDLKYLLLPSFLGDVMG